MDINFELYKIFYYAASSASFSDAAQKLFVTQSAVSQAIKCLEEKIGGRLFYRKSRRIILTDEGEVLYRHIEQAYNFIKTAENKVLEMRNLASGEIKIGIGDTICKYFLIPHLQEFIRIYPGIKIQVINRTSSQILEMLKTGTIDLGIVTLPVYDKGINVESFITVQDIFAAPYKYKELAGARVPLDRLVQYPMLLLQKNSSTRRNLDAFLRKKGLQIVPEIELESIDLLVEFARIGIGIAHVLRESAAGAISSGELFEVKTKEELPLRELGIATMDNVPLSRASEKFVKFLKKGAGQPD